MASGDHAAVIAAEAFDPLGSGWQVSPFSARFPGIGFGAARVAFA
jgi:hypothetical protein